MVRNTRFSWDDLTPDVRPQLYSAFDDADDEWEIDLTEPPPTRRRSKTPIPGIEGTPRDTEQ
ncbi:MAG: hypothetical protein R3C11_14030 [Planctomycetaceae bacterium]